MLNIQLISLALIRSHDKKRVKSGTSLPYESSSSNKTFATFIANMKLAILKDISFDDFDDKIEHCLPLKDNKMRCYQTMEGTKSERE